MAITAPDTFDVCFPVPIATSESSMIGILPVGRQGHLITLLIDCQ